MRLDFFPSSSSLRVWRRGYKQKVLKSISPSQLEECFRFPDNIPLDPSRKPVKSEETSDTGTTVTVNVPKVEPADWSTFKVDKEGFTEVYTDGACHDNGKESSIGGVGVWWGNGHKWNVSQPIVMAKMTNNLAEILAATIAIKMASTNGISKLLIKTDSQYVIDCVTSWMPNWKKNGWMTTAKQPVKNKQYLEDLDMAINLTKMQVKWTHVMSHSGIEGNEEADKLAVKGAAWWLDGSCTKPGEPKHGFAYLDAGTSGSGISTIEGRTGKKSSSNSSSYPPVTNSASYSASQSAAYNNYGSQYSQSAAYNNYGSRYSQSAAYNNYGSRYSQSAAYNNYGSRYSQSAAYNNYGSRYSQYPANYNYNQYYPSQGYGQSQQGYGGTGGYC